MPEIAQNQEFLKFACGDIREQVPYFMAASKKPLIRTEIILAAFPKTLPERNFACISAQFASNN
jgi:hypothetical protein